jgi:membrane protein implicated in regulation of membrane protease activity
MRKILAYRASIAGLTLAWIEPVHAAIDSYRFLHVTIDTPWMIFVFLLFAVLAPFVLMAVLVWRYTERRTDAKKRQASENQESEQ